MRPIEEIKSSLRLNVMEEAEDGFNGTITLPNLSGTFVFSFADGWEHVSVTPFKRHTIPSWEDMCRVNDIFFTEDEWTVEFHPPVSEYVNNVANCLHILKPTKEVMPTPPWWMVGIKKGKTMADAMREADEALKTESHVDVMGERK